MPSSLIKQASARLSRRSCPPGLAIILAGQLVLVLVPDPLTVLPWDQRRAHRHDRTPSWCRAPSGGTRSMSEG